MGTGEERFSIFKFDSYIDFLKVAAQPRPVDDHRLKATIEVPLVTQPGTLDTWAKRLGYRSPSSLSMVLNGQRLPSRDMLDAISLDLQLTSLEKDYFLLLVKLERCKRKGKDIVGILEQIYRLNNRRTNAFHVTHEQFSYISEWHHFALKQLIGTPDFREDYEWMHKKLRKKASPAKLREAMENLIKLGIVSRNAEGRVQVAAKGIETPNDEVVSAALRSHHKGMIQRALEAIDEQGIENRYLNAITLKLDKQKIPEAKQFITRFIKEFGQQFGSSDANAVYQLNIQMFEHTSAAGGENEESL